jgi:hypothetical protein
LKKLYSLLLINSYGTFALSPKSSTDTKVGKKKFNPLTKLLALLGFRGDIFRLERPCFAEAARAVPLHLAHEKSGIDFVGSVKK